MNCNILFETNICPTENLLGTAKMLGKVTNVNFKRINNPRFPKTESSDCSLGNYTSIDE